MSERVLASPAAVAYIERQLQVGRAHAEVASLVPALCVSFGWHSEKEGRVVEHCSIESFHVGWFKAEVAGTTRFGNLQVGGVKLRATAYALGRLAGKRLVLEEVGVGVPVPTE